jgi:hypothetical protein
MSPNQSFLLLSCLSQVFFQRNGKLTNTMLYPYSKPSRAFYHTESKTQSLTIVRNSLIHLPSSSCCSSHTRIPRPPSTSAWELPFQICTWLVPPSFKSPLRSQLPRKPSLVTSSTNVPSFPSPQYHIQSLCCAHNKARISVLSVTWCH